METATNQTESLRDFSRRAEEILNARIRGHLTHTTRVLDRIETEQPTDAIAPAKALRFAGTDRGIAISLGDHGAQPVHSWARGQIVDRAGITRTFANDLIEHDSWGPELLAHNLREIFARQDSRHLVRSVGGQVRGFLSDKYRRLDARPLIHSFLESVQTVGALPYESHLTDTKIAIKAIYQRPVRLSETEVLAFGVAFETSDFGNGPVSVSLFAERLVCLNGLITSRDLRKAHLGARLSDDLSWSSRTMDLDTQTTASAIRDVVRGRLSAESQERFVDQFRAADSEQVSPESITAFLKNAVSKERAKQITETFASADVTMLPAGQSRYRLSQAISLVANRLEGAPEEEKLDLQRLAGLAIEGK